MPAKTKTKRTAPKQPKQPCPKCGSPRVHKCKTGECMHCDVCSHAFFPGQLDTTKHSYAQFKRGAIEKPVVKDTWIELARDAVGKLSDISRVIAKEADISEEAFNILEALDSLKFIATFERRIAKLDGQLELFA